ncbi:MAG: hypothetical protein A2001_12370 [Treponema sp. GWC1_61_84]|nr:MAG: hypothetical protein A2001_12370 [Treponema sp. GWC1_61_84]
METNTTYRFLFIACIAAFVLSFGACAGAARATDPVARETPASADGGVPAATDSAAPVAAEPRMEKSAKTAPREAEAGGADSPGFVDEEDSSGLSRPSPTPFADAAVGPARGSGTSGASGTARAPGPARAPAESGLKAGVSDDNAQYNWFMNFLTEHAGAWPFRPVPAANRIILSVIDARGAGVPNAAVSIRDASGTIVDSARSYADGRIFLTPPADARGNWSAETSGAKVDFDPSGPRSIEITLQGERRTPSPVPMDIVFVMDTTGSMGEEIERLKATVDIIRDNLDLAAPRPRLRFGLVLYKDRGDEYLVHSYPLTDDLENFRRNLALASAGGGGDEPEDLESALAAAVDRKMLWNADGVRLVFVVTDAPAQAYPGAVGYDKSAEAARAAGIRIHTIGTGGLPLAGEYQLRQIAQRTRGRYIFLTYGERGESEGGAVGAVSHHTGSNWTADRLEAVIIRLAKEELSLMSGGTVSVPSDDWFEAKTIGGRPSDEILDELFGEAIGRLLDYSSAAVGASTPAAVLPVGLGAPGTGGTADAALLRDAERFGARLLQATVASRRLRLVERADLQSVLAELELSLSAIGDPEAASRLGRLLGAEVLVVPTLVPLDAAEPAGWELYLKLVRVATAEILSVSRARIGRGLGLD